MAHQSPVDSRARQQSNGPRARGAHATVTASTLNTRKVALQRCHAMRGEALNAGMPCKWCGANAGPLRCQGHGTGTKTDSGGRRGPFTEKTPPYARTPGGGDWKVPKTFRSQEGTAHRPWSSPGTPHPHGGLGRRTQRRQRSMSWNVAALSAPVSALALCRPESVSPRAGLRTACWTRVRRQLQQLLHCSCCNRCNAKRARPGGALRLR